MRVAAVLVALAALVSAACGGSDADNQARQTTERPAGTSGSDPDPSRAAQRHPAYFDTGLRYFRRQAAETSPNARLTEVALEFVPLDVKVWCWSERIWREAERRLSREAGQEVRFAGFTDYYATDIHLEHWICDALDDFAAGEEIDAVLLADALSVFTHETRHFSSTGSNEATTECRALQRMADVGVRLGASEEQGQKLAELAWKELYPTLPAEYRSAECRPGGLLDREPETPEFP